MLSKVKVFLRKATVLPIRVYQYCISPLFPAKCRFYPTCSSYAIKAITEHGVFKGFALALWRILRCNPWNKGGYDPVPSHCSFPSIKDR